jgi:hypothetical protein
MVSFVRSVPDPLLSSSEQHSLEFHPSWSLLGHSPGLSMFAILSMAYRVLLIAPNWLLYLPNWFLILPPKNGLNTCSVSIQVF